MLSGSNLWDLSVTRRATTIHGQFLWWEKAMLASPNTAPHAAYVLRREGGFFFPGPDVLIAALRGVLFTGFGVLRLRRICLGFVRVFTGCHPFAVKE